MQEEENKNSDENIPFNFQCKLYSDFKFRQIYIPEGYNANS